MPRNKYPEKTEKKILDVSRELFFSKGYDETSMQDILDHGLSKGAIYHHFNSKREIFERIMDELEGNLSAKQHETTATTALENLKMSLLGQLENKKKIALLKRAQSLFDDPKVFGEIYKTNMKDSTEIIKTFIIRGNQDGSIKCLHILATAELIVQFFSIWVGTSLYLLGEDEVREKIDYYKDLFVFSGIPLIDEQIQSAIMAYYRALI